MELNLNTAQREAVTSTEGFIRVIAGAGSGKTRALSHRFAFLVNELGVLPGNILCVTFTNKSANEMRRRIHQLTGDNDTGYINTFHGFCVSVLHEDAHAVFYPRRFLVLDNEDINAMLQIIYDERGLTLRDMTFKAARDMIEIRKLLKEPNYYLDMITMSADVLKEKYRAAVEPSDIIFYGYLYQEKKCFGLDYNDLIIFTLHIFREHSDICQKWQRRLEYIMIDEFQDIDNLQYQLMEILCGYHKNLFIVGDPDQTIYTWRGANVRYLLDFDKVFPNVKTILMTKNYRSTPQILSAANALINKNRIRIQKELVPVRPDGQPVLCHYAVDSASEAEWIAGQMQTLHDRGVPYCDMTVLYRASFVSRAIETALMQNKIPYTVYSGVQFFDRKEIKDALSYLRMLIYRDDLSFRRIVNVPKRNIGKQRIALLETYALEHNCSLYQALQNQLESGTFKRTGAEAFCSLVEDTDYENRSVSETLSELLNRSGYEEQLRQAGDQERLDNLSELKQSIYEYETTCGEELTLEHYLSYITFFTNRDADSGGDRVKLMTIHAAKGLEFPYVFLCGMNEGILPSRKVRTRQEMEEERRLAFVALTRAEDGLYLSESAGRNQECQYPSRFLLDIGGDFLQYTSEPPDSLIRDARRWITAQENEMPEDSSSFTFQAGQRVRHAVFGAGTVLESAQNFCMVQFDDLPTPRKLSVRAKLERLE